MIKEITNIVEQSIRTIKEAYVTAPKKFDLRTELLSKSVKEARQKDFEKNVEALNSISTKLDSVEKTDLNEKSSDFRRLKLDEVYNMNCSLLKAKHFENISDLRSMISMEMLSFIRLERDFGTFDDWQKDFMACCMTSRNGFAITAYCIFLNRYINFVVDSDALHIPVGCVPVIVLDVSEGAYYRDYVGDKKTYVMSMMKELNWNKIEKRFEQSEKIANVLKNKE